MGLSPEREQEGFAIIRIGDLELAIEQDWGEGDSALTLAIQSSDCAEDYTRAVANGAKSRVAPRDKATTIGASVFGPGKLVFEWEQSKG